jgi:hypothetical protein
MRTLGQIFRETRETKGITAIQAAEITRIKPQMLDHMEADLWAKIPAPIYARGFIKIYAECLDLAPEPLIEAYTRWTHTERKRPPFIGEAEPEPAPSVLAPVIPALRPPEPKHPFRPVKASPPPPAEEKQPVLAPVAPVPPAPPRPSSVPRPAFIPSRGNVFAGMGRYLKYIPIGLVMILAVVLLFSALKRWGRLSGHSDPSVSVAAGVRASSSSGSHETTSGGGSSGLKLAEDPPDTYLNDSP